MRSGGSEDQKVLDSLPCSLQTVRLHSIFSTSNKRSPKPDEEWELISRPAEDDLVPTKKQRLIMRDKDMIFARGKEVRMMSCTGESFEIRLGKVGKYATLTSPNLSFEIFSLILNPTGRLLAVVGRSQIIVLVLPRPGSATRGEITCRSIVIDAHQYAPSSSSAIVKVLWHPLGQGGESLWILDSDGQLREYDIQSPHDPVETFAFLSTSASTSRFSAIDPSFRYATSFAFGAGSRAGWGECVVYGLMANGDLHTLCPVLPFRTEVKVEWVQRLKAYVGHAGTEEETYWVESIARQVQVPDKQEDGIPGTPSIRTSILGRSTRNPENQTTAKIDGNQLVKLHPPHLTASGGPAPGVHREVERQGPAIFQPAPEEDEEDMASDLAVTTVSGKDGAAGEVRFLGICWSSGRVDVGVEIERVQGKWADDRSSRSKAAITTISIIESIQLDVSPRFAPDNSPAFISDPLHADTVYIRHMGGVDAVSVAPISKAITSDDKDLPGCDIAQLVQTANSEATPIEGLAICHNMTLGYGLLALNSSNRLATVELDYRGMEEADTSLVKDDTPAVHETDHSSLLTSQPLDTDNLLASIRPSQAYTTSRAALQKVSANKPLTTITPAHLRAIGDLVSALQTRIEAVRRVSQTIESHLDLQAREFGRQLQLLQQTSRQLTEVREHSAISRAEGMMKEQDKLSGRLEIVLSGLVGRYRPPVGEVEKGWFEELEGLRVKIRGGKGFGLSRGGGLKAQVNELEEQFEDIKSVAESAKRDFMSSATTSPRQKQRYGAKEIRPLESALYQRIDEIARLMRKMESLKVQVDDALDAGRGEKGAQA